MRRFAFAFTLLLAGSVPSVASADTSRFGELFPDQPSLTSQTNQQLADLAQTQLDPGAASADNCDVKRPESGCVGSGFTYVGQFIDHDLTLDTSPSPLAPVDFTQLINNRSLRFDLDSVYGGGPATAPQLYKPDGKHFRVQDPNPNGVRDLPRNADGSAVLVEGRDDENEIIAQLHTAFLLAHNAFVDKGLSFAQARRALVLYYQRAVVDDYLPHVAAPLVTSADTNADVSRLVLTGMTPIEFSVAAFRFGHSQVRQAYELNEDSGLIDVFNLAGNDLHGGRQIPAGRQIGWGNFFPELADPDDADGGNISRRIDPLISGSLFQLPIPGAEAAGSNVLAFRNMIRAKFYDMPSGQTLARRMGLTVLSSGQLHLPSTVAAAFKNGVPLWYYILAESSVREDGRRLGPVGSRIVNETFTATLLRDPDSILRGNAKFQPAAEIAGADGKVQFSDILRFAGVVDTAEG
jgi:hypothetical protein